MTQLDNAFGSNGAQQFDLGDIISVYHDVLASPNGVDGLSQTLTFLTGELLMGHQLPIAGKFCRPFIEKQFPEIKQIDTSTLQDNLDQFEDTDDGRDQAVREWVRDQADKLGKDSVDLVPLTDEQMMGFRQYLIDNSVLVRAGVDTSHVPESVL